MDQLLSTFPGLGSPLVFLILMCSIILLALFHLRLDIQEKLNVAAPQRPQS